MSRERKRIYIVDDDESVCRALEFLMMTYGFDVRTFVCAEDFFSAVPNNTPGCLLLDIYMPGIDGWTAHERLSKSGSKRPIIIMTIDKNDGLRERALEVGAAGFIQKPVNDRELVSLINKVSTN